MEIRALIFQLANSELFRIIWEDFLKNGVQQPIICVERCLVFENTCSGGLWFQCLPLAGVTASPIEEWYPAGQVFHQNAFVFFVPIIIIHANCASLITLECKATEESEWNNEYCSIAEIADEHHEKQPFKLCQAALAYIPYKQWNILVGSRLNLSCSEMQC